MFLKISTTYIMLWVLLACNCLGLGTKVDHPRRDHSTADQTNQPQTAPQQPSAPPYEETKVLSADPAALPPSYEAATAPPSYEEAIASPFYAEHSIPSSHTSH